VADITYIHILVCFVYLAVILDVYSRKAIGYALSRKIDTNLTLNALRMAIHNRQPKPGCIHHSDQGVQYASADYVKELEFYDFQISMSRKGNPYDNAYAESFIKTLKSEEVQLWEYRTLEDVQKRIPYFIEDVYNQKRLHSSLGYRPPCEFEKMLTLTHNPCHDTLIVLP
jgi:transposase InsO family protein